MKCIYLYEQSHEDHCGAHTFPYIHDENKSSIVEHEATTSKISEDQLFYLQQRGISEESAIGLIVNGYAREVLKQLPSVEQVEESFNLILNPVKDGEVIPDKPTVTLK